MDTPFLSVIVALYNAEIYLPACIASVRACGSERIECILVNDGSTDGSRAICESVIAEDSRFRLLNKENGGVSDSRNAGIRAARGAYLFFLDADDYVDAKMWPHILGYAQTSDADLVAFGYRSLFPSGREQEERFRIPGGVSDQPSDVYLALLASPMLNTCWGKLLRRSVVEAHALRFDPSLITCEDAVFILDFVAKARTFLLCNLCVLYYRIHGSSATRLRPLERKLEDFSVLYARRTAFLEAHPDPALRHAAYLEGFSVLTDMLLEYAARHNLRETRAACRLLLTHPVAREICVGVDPRGVSPVYKKLERAWMRRNLSLPLSLYFRVKSLFRKGARSSNRSGYKPSEGVRA